MHQPIWQLDASAQAALLADAELDPVELFTLYRDRIERINPRLNAVVCLNEAASDDAAASAQRRAQGQALSPIDGLPILIKDNLVVRDLPATWGSALYRDRQWNADEIPVARLRAAGAIILGKTNVPEFTVEGFTDNALFGVTPNPWDLSLTPGGSSGGSAAAVAAGLAPWAIGTDGGGSIRRPAAYTNLIGLKPSIGRIPRGGGLPQLLLDMEVIGTLTRSARDQMLLLGVLAGRDLRDHRSLRLHPFDADITLAPPPQPLRILAVERFGAAPLDPQIRSSFEGVQQQLARMGHSVEPGPLPLDIEALNRRWGAIGQIGLASLLQREPRMAELTSPKYLEWARTAHPASELWQILETIDGLRDRAAEVFDAVDVIMTPSCAAMPWPTGVDFPAEIDGQPVGPRGSAVYTGWVNACGHPAISLPGPPGDADLPIGIQFVAGFGRELQLLQLAHALEPVYCWTESWPHLAGLKDDGAAGTGAVIDNPNRHL